MSSSALEEWRRYFMVPVAGGLGYATVVIHTYSFGAYIEPISREFGWSRTMTTAGLTIAMVLQAAASFPAGLAVDRLGPRIMALCGVPLTLAAYALLGTTTGGAANWYLLWILMGLAALPGHPAVWTSAVASRFNASLGLALAVTLCGAAFAAAVFPLMSAKLIQTFGWQQALFLQAGIWFLIAYPLILVFFRGAQDRRRQAAATEASPRAELPGVSVREGARSSIYLRLMIACFLFTFSVLGLTVHFVPILTDADIGKLEAAGIASTIGIVGVIGRFGTGFMLDRFRGAIVGGVAFLLPAIGLLVMIIAGLSPLSATIGAILIGLSLGAEIDVIAFLTARHFGLKSFGALYGGLMTALLLGTALGSLGAAKIFDAFGGYRPYLWLCAGLLTLCAMLLFSLPRYRGAEGGSKALTTSHGTPTVLDPQSAPSES